MPDNSNIEEIPTYKIKEVEIFSAGIWNKDKYSIEDLYSIVSAFNSLKDGFKPYLKLGHDDTQKLVRSSGLPSIGWVENIYVKGEKLFADLNNIPKKIFNLIKAKAYRKVSCEIYWDLDVNGIKYPRVLSAIALLGAETPGVLNLADILGNYNLIQNNKVGVFEAMEKQDNFKSYALSFETNTEDVMVEEIEKVKSDLDEQRKSYTKIQVDFDAKQKENESLQKDLEKYKLEAEKSLIAEKAAKVSKFITELESKKLSTPGMKDLITEFLSDKKEYVIKEKNMSKEEVLSEILTLSKEAAKVNFDENSRADFAKKEDKQKGLADKIEKYSSDNKVSYKAAYKAVMKEMSPEEMADQEEDAADASGKN